MVESLMPRGRVGRLRYHLVGLFAQALMTAPVIALFLLEAGREGSRRPLPETRLLVPFMLLFGCSAVIAVWISFCNTCKRLHDLDRSGWDQLLLMVPIYNWYLGLLMGFGRGSCGENRYGLPEGHGAAVADGGKEARWCPGLYGVTATPSRPMAS